MMSFSSDIYTVNVRRFGQKGRMRLEIEPLRTIMVLRTRWTIFTKFHSCPTRAPRCFLRTVDSPKFHALSRYIGRTNFVYRPDCSRSPFSLAHSGVVTGSVVDAG
jgi:hypothetical protein